MEEALIRNRFRVVALRLGTPDASKIGQHEVVSSEVLGALDRAAHDEEVMVLRLTGVPPEEATNLFMSIRDHLLMDGFRTMDEQTFNRVFLHKL